MEVIASPLSNLTGLNGIATSGPKSKPKQFPDPKAVKIEGWNPATVTYDAAFNVKRKRGGDSPPIRENGHESIL